MTAIFKDPRKREYLNGGGAGRPLKNPIAPETVRRARAYRKRRIIDQVAAHDCAALLMFDPVNIRYALDISNMQVWMLHNAWHYALVCADGHAVDFEYFGSLHVAQNLETVDEVRPAQAWYYFAAGPRVLEAVEPWADEIAEIVGERGGGNRRLAVDKLEPAGVDALRRRGITIVEGQQLAETARGVKGPDELELMKWTIRVCEAGMARIYENSLPGKTENEIWAELHYENIRCGGEWIETRLLTAGRRTNPWFQECSDNVCETGDLLAFDTDMIGPYGYCADLSRSWPIGHVRMSEEQKTLYRAARDQIDHNLGLLRPGLTFAEFNEKCWKIPERYQAQRYSTAFHGVGMADEWPRLATCVDGDPRSTGMIEENMVICVESLIGEEHGRECVKLETQALIAAGGAVRLDTFPWEEV
jgi:Xaa-Pro aminopeptidase